METTSTTKSEWGKIGFFVGLGFTIYYFASQGHYHNFVGDKINLFEKNYSKEVGHLILSLISCDLKARSVFSSHDLSH
jgi:hypothetical protein